MNSPYTSPREESVSIRIELEFKTHLVLVDKKTTSPPVKAKALLLDDDSVPFLIGFEDILTDIKLVCDYRTKTAFLQIPI